MYVRLYVVVNVQDLSFVHEHFISFIFVRLHSLTFAKCSLNIHEHVHLLMTEHEHVRFLNGVIFIPHSCWI